MSPFQLDKTRIEISKRVRRLRLQRGWTQVELARLIDLSQNRLSEIERGNGSFTAEQIFAIAKLFNVPLQHFLGARAGVTDELQNSLARLGASHLMEGTDVLPSEQVREALAAVRETLVSAGSSRQLTSLAPVLVEHIDRLDLKRLLNDLVGIGMERRLGWLIENIVEAICREQERDPPRALKQRYRRTDTLLSEFLAIHLLPRRDAAGRVVEDVLDDDILTKKTLQEVKEGRTASARRWSIVTRLQPDDFIQALRAAHG